MDFQYTELKYLNFALYSPLYLIMLITLQNTLIFFYYSSVAVLGEKYYCMQHVI